MHAGDANNLFTIQTPSDTQDGETGAVTRGWVDAGNVWGSLTATGATMQNGDGYDINQVSHKIVCRFKSALTKDARLKLRDRYFHVVDLVPDDRAKEMTITVHEAAGG